MTKAKKSKITNKSSIIVDAPIIETKKKIKKVVKKIIPEIILPIVKAEPQKTSEDENKIKPSVSVFYGHNIRSTYMNNQWYFSLEDILKLCDIIDPTKFLIDLKNQPEVKDIYYQIVETFSYYENSNPIIIPVVNFQSFTQLLPHIRLTGSTLPGPFPEWLENMANRSF
jgi:hypothetical protein